MCKVLLNNRALHRPKENGTSGKQQPHLLEVGSLGETFGASREGDVRRS